MRQAAGDRPRAWPTSSNVSPNTSCSTNAARSAGLSVSRTTSIAHDTVSARLTESAGSGAVSTGSGSHGPTYFSRRVRAERSVSSAIREVVVTSQPVRSRIASRSLPWSLIQASWTASSASARVPSSA